MTYHEELRAFKVSYWKKILRQAGGNITLAAKMAGVNRTHMHRIVLKYDLSPPKVVSIIPSQNTKSWSTQYRMRSKYA
jgi:hypothetical protein